MAELSPHSPLLLLMTWSNQVYSICTLGCLVEANCALLLSYWNSQSVVNVVTFILSEALHAIALVSNTCRATDIYMGTICGASDR